MYIENNVNTQLCTIWVEKENELDYKKDERYKEAIKESKRKGYSVCVYVGGELPIISVIDEAISPNPIIA